MPRRTDSHNPADWLWIAEVLEKILKAELLGRGCRPLVAALAEVYFAARYPGFDFDDPDWITVRTQLAAVAALLAAVKARLGAV